ncbi:NADP-dependent oxidoreductase domain-containing protein [Crepidotus variabilis]|uniref:NADP-dependent oxidoreductase domain-containing protein n=1 Tax=Crepidotus variabilis TaxID=179855 RepID=A0A9P6JJX7_9AGAR|nr:NADP-dependent oxidoreductase domain-containing protein [Crepidotus variabilis]
MTTSVPAVETFRLGPHIASRIWTGLWQLSSPEWGTAKVSKIREAMARHVAMGYNGFDMADHYGSAEVLFGEFYRSSPYAEQIVAGTKWCVFKTVDPTRDVVFSAICERMERMKTRRVDLLQFHWQDYSDNRYLMALHHLADLKDEGYISALGLCNFDAIRTDEICTELGPGVVVSNQIQFSLIDTRALHGMSDVCQKHGLKLLTYGTLCGGFLSDKWLGKPEPQQYGGYDQTPSTRKYLDMIVKAWGSWDLFQTLLQVLRQIGDRHGRSISNIAMRWVLDHPFVGAVLIGARLGVSEHVDDNRLASGFRLTKHDLTSIDSVLDRSRGRTMIASIGDCGAEYR